MFAFFGVVATAGSAYVHTESLTGIALGASVPVGLLATSLLVVNNLRDIPTDARSGKRTLAVRIGDRATRALYTVLVAAALVAVVPLALARPAAAFALLTIPFAVPALRRIASGATGPALVAVLADTGRLQLVFGVVLAVGLWLSA